jgi:hypothetical protein
VGEILMVTTEELLAIFSRSFKSDLANLIYMMETRGITIDDIKPFLNEVRAPERSEPKCPVCGKFLRLDNCCSNKGRWVCNCGYVE